MVGSLKQAVIWAGGRGSRLGSLTEFVPKPLIKVEGTPIIVHIMKRLAHDGIKEFVILTGHLHEKLEDYFVSKRKRGESKVIENKNLLTIEKLDIKGLEDSIVNLLFTGDNTLTGGRLKKALEENVLDERFVLTYGDTYSTVSIKDVDKFSKNKDKDLTIIGVPYSERFGIAVIDDDGDLVEFAEKSASDKEFINGGFMVVNKTLLERSPVIKQENPGDFSTEFLGNPIHIADIAVMPYYGYWTAMDTELDLSKVSKNYRENKENWLD